MAVLDTTYGNLVIKDISHAIDKDTRTLFASDNRKNDKRKAKISNIPELHLLSYYGDITGPKELHLRNQCMKLIRSKFKKMRFKVVPVSSNYKEHQSWSDLSVDTATIQTIFNSLQITHISHYSFEFVVNISTTSLLDEYKTDSNTTKSNCYLVSTYQRSEYNDHFNEFVTLGVTSAVSNNDYEDRKNRELYNFYVDDFIQDLYVILFNTSWFDDSCHLPTLLWYTIAQFTMDCLLPVPYTRSLADEVVLNDGSLHFYLTGELSPRNVIPEVKEADESGDAKTNNEDEKEEEEEYKPLKMDPKLELIGKVFVEVGRVIHSEYNSRNKAKKIKSEYDKWKSKGFKKRALLKPINMKDLRTKLQKHQTLRSEARDRKSVNDLKYIYYKNPNFGLKKLITKAPKPSHQHFQTAQPSAMKSFINFFSFGSSKGKVKLGIPAANAGPSMGHRRSLSTGAVSSQLSRSHTDRSYTASPTKKKNTKGKKKSAFTEWDADADYNWSNDDYGTQYITTSSQFITSSSTQPAGWQAAASVPTGKGPKPGAPEPILRSKSTGKKADYNKKRRVPVINRAKKYTHPRTGDDHRFLSMDMLLEEADSNSMDANDDAYEEDGGAAVFGGSHSAERMRRPVSPKLVPTMSKPTRAKSAETGSNTSGGSYAHDDNEILYLDSYHQSNQKGKKQEERKKETGAHGRRDSMTTMKVKNDIRKAYKDYTKEKGHRPKDIQSFVSYCKRKNIKKANWTLCKVIINESANGNSKDKIAMLQSETIVE